MSYRESATKMLTTGINYSNNESVTAKSVTGLWSARVAGGRTASVSLYGGISFAPSLGRIASVIHSTALSLGRRCVGGESLPVPATGRPTHTSSPFLRLVAQKEQIQKPSSWKVPHV